ncbi:proteophosphoglycan precursor [Pseudomonas oryzihabitans]|nr:proteophosphoglycan precursor [Pseudomonas psychrotolerans]KTS94034.1 proteophosphoglycan precursor [Pseudomonas psychrotolerans]KTT20533.1 proteophosphoglycan precursor [Pseudomonas psychrotolerans]KTT56175.1 proteophosphoglycan precursor [Pseudomonas psychrotolerans]KTT63329.1 proteophosphoglycan precursor [Pseudomonas psychrotolerans]
MSQGDVTRNLLAQLPAVQEGSLPPVHLWHPPFCGDIDMRIARDGTWYHQGTPITRPAMVRLFSTILRRDPERYVLVTPVECVGIQVEDVPFLAVDVEWRGDGAGQELDFLTNVGDRVAAGAEYPLRFAQHEEQPAPYVRVRGGLEARINRAVFYRLMERVEQGTHEGHAWLGLWSRGVFFPVAPAE